jgi:hypothetical protein
MDGSKEDAQAGCIEKPYWGATKKACDVDQYDAPPMDGSKDNQAGAPTVVSARAPPTAVMPQGAAAPTARPTGVLALAVRKRRPT